MPEGESTIDVSRSSGDLYFGPFRFDRRSDLLYRDPEQVPLPPRVIGVMRHLLEHRGALVSKKSLLKAVWKDAFVTETSLTEAMSLLRQALEDDPQHPTYVQTVHRRGYRFIAPVSEKPPTPAAGDPAEPRQPTEGPAEPSSTERMAPGARPLPAAGRSSTIALAAVTLLVIGGLAFWQLQRRPTLPEQPVTRFAIPLHDQGSRPGHWPSVAISPDGRVIAFVETGDTGATLFLRSLDRLDPQPVPGSQGASAPFFSPDGAWVAFFANGQLKKTAVGGGPPTTLCGVTLPAGGSWGPDDRIVFAQRGGLFRIATSGGTPEPLTRTDPRQGEIGHWWPDVLPNGKGVLFTVWTTVPGSARIEVLSLDGGARRVLAEGSTYPRFAAATGHLVYAREGALYSAPFDPEAQRLTGPEVPVLTEILTNQRDGSARFAFSANGSLVYLPGNGDVPERALYRMAPGGQESPLPVPQAQFGGLDLAPDGLRAALTIRDGLRSDLWITEVTRGTLRRLTRQGHNVRPIWTPDGRWIVFASADGGPFNLFIVDAEGGEPRPLGASPNNQYPASFSPDGQELLYTDDDPETGSDIWALRLDDGARRAVLRTRWDETSASYSPDGRVIAYQSNESGTWEVSLRGRDGAGPSTLVSVGGGTDPFWSHDGRNLFYRSGPRLMVVDVLERDGFAVGSPRVAFERHDVDWQVACHDAHGFLLLRDTRAISLSTHLNVVLAWFNELRQRSAPSA